MFYLKKSCNFMTLERERPGGGAVYIGGWVWGVGLAGGLIAFMLPNKLLNLVTALSAVYLTCIQFRFIVV